jgi:hypothetical protein
MQLLLLGKIRASAELAKDRANSDLRLAELGKYECRFARSYGFLAGT